MQLWVVPHHCSRRVCKPSLGLPHSTTTLCACSSVVGRVLVSLPGWYLLREKRGSAWDSPASWCCSVSRSTRILPQTDHYRSQTPSTPVFLLVSSATPCQTLQALRHLQSKLQRWRKPWSATASKPVTRTDHVSHGTCKDSTWKRTLSSYCRNNVPLICKSGEHQIVICKSPGLDFRLRSLPVSVVLRSI